MKTISTTEAPATIGPYSQAMQVGDILYTSGQIGLTVEGEMAGEDIHDQAHQVLKNLGAVLAEVGATYSDVIKTTIFLADMDDFLAVNTVYAEYFGEHKPARSTVAVKALPRDAKVEIECIAKIMQYNY
jgi:2-iminobutanoate/2-iminopropanoate deaminase